MSLRISARRFEPRYGVSQAALDLEAGYLAKEVENYLVLPRADIAEKLTKRRPDSKQSWEHLQFLLDHLSDGEPQTLQCVLFRDIYLLLELYLTHLRNVQPQQPAPLLPVEKSKRKSRPFREWLFDSIFERSP